MEYDPTQFVGAAPYYLAGRPPYSAQLADVLLAELGLDGHGRLLDVGCGPGVLAVQLATIVDEVTGIDPDAGMVTEARSYAAQAGIAATFVQAQAEQIRDLGLPPVRLVTFGQSFHRVDRLTVAEVVYDLLETGGAMVLVVHDIDHGTSPCDAEGTVDPPIPHAAARAMIHHYLGPELRSGARPASSYDAERFEESLARTRFGRPETVWAPGRRDFTQSIDDVIANFLSMSYAAPHLFGDRLNAFVTDLRVLLAAATTTGRFHHWPGDTAALICRKGIAQP